MATAMQQGRIDKVLNTKMNFGEPFGILTKRDWLNQRFESGNCYTETRSIHPFYFNGKKFNNMYQDEQDEYERKYNLMVDSYNLMTKDCNIFTQITKIEFDYFNSLNNVGQP